MKVEESLVGGEKGDRYSQNASHVCMKLSAKFNLNNEENKEGSLENAAQCMRGV